MMASCTHPSAHFSEKIRLLHSMASSNRKNQISDVSRQSPASSPPLAPADSTQALSPPVVSETLVRLGWWP